MPKSFSQNLALIIAGFTIESRLKGDRAAKEYIGAIATDIVRLKELPIDARLSQRIAAQLMSEGRGTMYKKKGEYFYSPNVQLSLLDLIPKR